MHYLYLNNMFLVEWKTIDYNIGSHFDGKIFTAPKTGLYSFNVMALQQDSSDQSRIYLNINNTPKITALERQGTASSHGNMAIQATLKVSKDDKVDISFHGKLDRAYEPRWTYFEGRLISPIEE